MSLCIITKEINNQCQFDPNQQPKEHEPDFLEKTQKKPKLSKGRNNKSPINIQQTKPTVPTETLQVNKSESTGPTNKVTVVISDSMVKRAQGRKIGGRVGFKVVFKAFPGATTADIKHFLKPKLNKQVGTKSKMGNNAFLPFARLLP